MTVLHFISFVTGTVPDFFIAPCNVRSEVKIFKRLFFKRLFLNDLGQRESGLSTRLLCTTRWSLMYHSLGIAVLEPLNDQNIACAQLI